MKNNENILHQRTETENLSRLLFKKQSVEERIYAVLREIMTAASKIEGLKKDDLIHILDKYLDVEMPNADYPEYEKISSVNKKLLRLTACSVLDEIAPGKRKISDFLAQDNTRTYTGEIAYLKNPISDKAHRSFSKYITCPVSSLQSDFNSVCEAVYDGRADYCILPIENSTDGRLGSFYNLISKYELFICMGADILSNDENMRTRFALCAKSMAVLQHHKKDPVWHTELLVKANGDNSMADILFYADFFGLQTVKTDCTPALYSDKEYDMYVTLVSGEKELVKLLLFLALEQIRYTAVGIYTVI